MTGTAVRILGVGSSFARPRRSTAGRSRPRDCRATSACSSCTRGPARSRCCSRARPPIEAVGVESVAPAVDAARRNAARNRIANARFVAGEARRVLREWPRGEREGAPRPDLVVVDPPRAGLHPRVVARVAELRPARIVYVSCNPATLARDAAVLVHERGYTLDAAGVVNMFPHTAHVESIALLERQ